MHTVQLVHSLFSHCELWQLFCDIARWDNWEWPRAVATSLLGLEKSVTCHSLSCYVAAIGICLVEWSNYANARHTLKMSLWYSMLLSMVWWNSRRWRCTVKGLACSQKAISISGCCGPWYSCLADLFTLFTPSQNWHFGKHMIAYAANIHHDAVHPTPLFQHLEGLCSSHTVHIIS